VDLAAHISYRPAHSELKVLFMRVIRCFQTAYLLHLMAIASIFLSYFFTKEFLILWENTESSWKLILYGVGSIYFFTLILFSQFDARSRYQNYKLAKDRLFKYGFDSRLLKPFMFSRCQRDAIASATKDLKFQKEWKQLNSELGFRWYHILPLIVKRNPLVLLSKDYWSKTLFVSTYHSKYFLW